MKKFLILQLRPETAASDGEFEAFLRFGDIKAAETRRIRMETDGLPSINLDDYLAVIVGGGPYNVSDKTEKKDSKQIAFETKLYPLIDEIIDKDFPYFGACYGHGALAIRAGGRVSKEAFSEEVGATTINLSHQAAKDPLMKGLPKSFRAFAGHKEASQDVPDQAVLLASSELCPVQMIRVKENVYSTQFHPELDSAGLALRIKIYKDAGYFPPEDADKLILLANQETVTTPEIIFRRFIKRYRK